MVIDSGSSEDPAVGVDTDVVVVGFLVLAAGG